MLIPLIGGGGGTHYDPPVVQNGLGLYLDAGKYDSFGVSSGRILDLSTGGFDFDLGGGFGGTAPGFTGTQGGVSDSEYLIYDSVYDQLRPVSSSPSWITTANQLGSSGWTVMAFVYHNSSANQEYLSGIASGSLRFAVRRSSAGKLQILRQSGTLPSTETLAQTSGLGTISSGAWYCVGVGHDDSAGTSRFFINGASETRSQSYSGSAGNGTNVVIGNNNTATSASNDLDGHLAIFLGWSRLLDLAEMDQIYHQYAPRFGI